MSTTYSARLLCGWFARAIYHASGTVWMSLVQLLFNAAHVVDGSVDAINGEMAKRNLPPGTLEHVILASSHVHDGIRRERDGVVCGSLADADLVVAWKYKAKLVSKSSAARPRTESASRNLTVVSTLE
eukprot:6205257-Pleurochrysis_carterae.AAC.2